MQLLGVTLCCLLWRTLVLPASASQAPLPVQVNGLLHQSITMSCTWDQSWAVDGVKWKYKKNGSINILVDASTQPYREWKSQFTHRLEVSNNTTILTIREMRLEDSGTFIADITDTDGKEHSFTFLVTVYEHIPTPEITTLILGNTTDWCNVTLQCSVPINSSSLSYTWKYRHRDTEYQTYSTGDTVQVSLRPESAIMEFMCIVQNPVDQNYVSNHEQPKCLELGGSRVRRSHLTVIIVIIMLPLIAILIAAVIFFVTLWRKRRKEYKAPAENRYCEGPYIEVTTITPDHNTRAPSNSQQRHHSPYPKNAETIYTVLQNPSPT